VIDQRGGPVASASVRVSIDGIDVAATTSASGGTYLIADLPPGPATVDVRAPHCFGEKADLVLEPGTRLTRGLSLLCPEAGAADGGSLSGVLILRNQKTPGLERTF